MTRNGKLNAELFEGSTINTPSMLCVQDYLDALDWVESVGGVAGTIARSNANAAVIADWVARTPWVDFLARVPRDALQHLGLPQDRRPRGDGAAARDARGASPPDRGAARSRRMPPRTSPPIAMRRRACASGPAPRSRRSDVETLLPWLDWAFAVEKQALAKAA